jgi:hypothetical protein
MGVGMNLPPILAARYALRGVQIAAVVAVLLLATVGCATQTVRLEGFRISLPLIGDIGPKGWRPYAIELEGEVKTIRIDLVESRARHAASKRAYAEAQEEAARMQADIVEREVARQERITDEVRKDYQQRIAALRSRADRLRAEAGAGVAGSPDQVRVPADANAAARTDEAPDCQRLPAPDIETDLRCREIATEQALQLDALIQWVLRQFTKPQSIAPT